MNKVMGLKRIEKRQWISFGIWAVLYVLFTVWMWNWWLLLGLVVLVDIYLTKFVPWGRWKKSSNPKVQNVLNWVDDIVFALVAVYLINIFVFQNYQIPSSSLEKTLLVGDYLFVSKLSYGPRVPNTPISFPLVQNTLPVLNCKSYLEWPDWGYKRVKGLGHVRRDDIVVFNFPAGDTVMLNMPNPDYYSMVESVGREAIRLNKRNFGDVVYRPVDKRENYVKRCVGMPGDSLQIIDNQVYIDGKALENRKNVQFVYYIETDGTTFRDELFRRLKVSVEDRLLVSEPTQETGYYYQALPYFGFTKNAGGYYNPIYRVPLTAEALAMVKKLPSVRKVVIEPELAGGDVYPVDYDMGWTRDNYGPIWIPAKGATIRLDEKNLALYHRCIRNYENNKLDIGADGSVRINGAVATSYTFKYDYYWMMGDNRHCSADSRSWGFVPEDHIVGKPILVWLSLDKDRGIFDGGIRWNRMFRRVEAFN
jgi:signal peptidase I